MDDFIKNMSEIMEVETANLNKETVFRNVTQFDSMMGFSMICMIEEQYGKEIDINKFKASITIGDLFELATGERV